MATGREWEFKKSEATVWFSVRIQLIRGWSGFSTLLY